MTRWEYALNEYVADTEKMLSNVTDEKLQEVMVQFVSMEVDDVLTMSHTDRTLVLALASLAVLYILHRRADASAAKIAGGATNA